MEDDIEKSYYNVKRSRDEFAFEEIDNDFPYKIAKIGISLKKKVIFEYSSEYFRRKVGESPMGTYQIFGGNIPKDMETEKEFASSELAGNKNPPPPLICNLNRGSATRFNSIKAINLSPNLIKDFPTRCDNDNLDKKPIYYEAAKQRKPNFLYFTTYQHSNSTHPRAAGDAHEDNYDCLKYYKGGAGDATGFCCNDMCNCIQGLKLFYKSKEFITVEDPDGNLVTKERASFVDYTSVLHKFCCADPTIDSGTREFCLSTNSSSGNVSPQQMGGLGSELLSDSCDFGFDIIGGWPPGAINAIWKGCKPSHDEEDEEGNPILNPDGTKTRWYLVSASRGIIFHGGGNTNCGCTGKGGQVTISGYNDCVNCRYWSPGKIDKIFSECEDKPSDPTVYCDCVFTMEVDLGNDKIMYLTTLDYPTYKLSNWKKVEITEGGGVRSAGCGGEILYNCNDVS